MCFMYYFPRFKTQFYVFFVRTSSCTLRIYCLLACASIQSRAIGGFLSAYYSVAELDDVEKSSTLAWFLFSDVLLLLMPVLTNIFFVYMKAHIWSDHGIFKVFQFIRKIMCCLWNPWQLSWLEPMRGLQKSRSNFALIFSFFVVVSFLNVTSLYPGKDHIVLRGD